MHIQSILKQLGYSEHEVEIYLASLKMGEASITEISEQVGKPRTTVREGVEAMQIKGLMNRYLVRGHAVWAAVKPDMLLELQKERVAVLSEVLPELRAISHASGADKPSIRSYYGSEEIRLIFEDIIETKHPINAVVSWDDIREFLGNDFMDDFVERRFKHFLRIRLITPKTATAIKLKQTDADQLRVTRFLPPKFELHRVSNFIYDHKVAIISVNRKEPIGILIHDPDTVHAMEIYFESLWAASQDT